MLKRTIKANFDAYNAIKEEWIMNFHSLIFEVEAETEKELNEKVHKRCEIVCNEIRRDTGYEAIYQYC